jgi:hypothetical protein
MVKSRPEPQPTAKSINYPSQQRQLAGASGRGGPPPCWPSPSQRPSASRCCPAAGATAPTMTPARTPSPLAGRSLRPPVLWGVVFGAIQAAAPLGFWWLDPSTVYALSLTLIAAVYIGFAVADGRRTVIAVESGVAAVFVVLAAAGVTGPA